MLVVVTTHFQSAYYSTYCLEYTSQGWHGFVVCTDMFLPRRVGSCIPKGWAGIRNCTQTLNRSQNKIFFQSFPQKKIPPTHHPQKKITTINTIYLYVSIERERENQPYLFEHPKRHSFEGKAGGRRNILLYLSCISILV